jgi:AcrR family transcriptional regulator
MKSRLDSEVSAPERRGGIRDRVLDTAELLLREGSAEFSMRQLASAAGVSFATPFNHFGSKIAIAQALSARRIAEMSARFTAQAPAGDAPDRVLAAVKIAADVMLADSAVNRAVIGSLGMPTTTPGAIAVNSRALWASALGNFQGIDPNQLRSASAHLAEMLALMFRGCLSFWAAGEISDGALGKTTRRAAATVLLGFASRARRPPLVTLLAEQASSDR